MVTHREMSFLSNFKRIRESGCIEWTGYVNHAGYGQLMYYGKNWLAHRLTWTLVNGPIPPKKFLIHSCDNPPCCNLNHLRIGTPKDNAIDRSLRHRHYQQKKTHCLNGHEFSLENTFVANNGTRHCKACNRDRMARYRKEKRYPF